MLDQQKTIQTLFKPEQLKNAVVKTFNYSSSCVAYNKGSARLNDETGQENFEIKKLPVTAQLSCINTLLCTDINKDGKMDMVIGTNLPDCVPQFGRLDAGFGIILINKGNSILEEMPSAESGITIIGVIRDVKLITQKNSETLLFLRNNDYPVLYKIQRKKPGRN